MDFIRFKLVNKYLKSSAHFIMMPEQRKAEISSFRHFEDAIPSAVLLLLYEKDKKIHFVVTKRPTYNGIHSAQISLPGGKIESSDLSAEQTALRETHEEIGIPPSKIKIIGPLSPLYIPPSNFIVYPFIGIHEDIPVFVKNETEVDKIIEIEMNDFLEESHVKEKYFEAKDFRILAPYFEIAGAEIWGATAMILSEFKEIVKEFYSRK